MNCYNQLELIFKEIGILNSLAALGNWDNSVTMPKGGSALKQEQLAYLYKQINQKISRPEIFELICRAEEETLNDWQKANLRNIKNRYLHQKALEPKLAEELVKAKLKCELNWQEAKKENNFKLFAEYFAPLLKLTQEVASLKAEIFEVSAYDALLDEYDQGRKSSDIDHIFNKLENFLPEFIAQVKEKQKNHQTYKFSLPITKQKEIGLFCMKALGFDLSRGRLDESAHPFSTGFSPDDVRITARYSEDNFVLQGLAAILHETGHGIYEQNLPKEFLFQPVAEACGMTIHESQSLFFERHIGISKEFFNWLQTKYSDLDAENMYNISVKVGDSLIRVQSDEISYPAHIIMRYKLEKAMLNGDLFVSDLPQVWNEESLKLFGREPKNLAEGCLQDIHWSIGHIGYFPTYTLGAIFAAQIDAHMRKNLDINYLISKGDFQPIITWLRDNIYSLGFRYNSNELIKKSTACDLDVDVFKNYLTNKYL